jgi:hypothetical protein
VLTGERPSGSSRGGGSMARRRFVPSHGATAPTPLCAPAAGVSSCRACRTGERHHGRDDAGSHDEVGGRRRRNPK